MALWFDKVSREWKLIRAQDREATTRHAVQPRAPAPKFVPMRWDRRCPGAVAFTVLGGFDGGRR